jgi:hypothetical protein
MSVSQHIFPEPIQNDFWEIKPVKKDRGVPNLQRHQTPALVSCQIKLLAFSYYDSEQSSRCFACTQVVITAISSTIKMILTYCISQAEIEKEKERVIYDLCSCTLL